MNEEKELRKENDLKPEKETKEEVEGYAYCATNKQRCLTDCPAIGGYISPVLTTLN